LQIRAVALEKNVKNAILNQCVV